MARIARVVVPGIPHHITQRGNRRLPTFFCPDDYHAYMDLMAEWCDKRGVQIWAYCLMPNHTHLIAVPEKKESLRRGIGEAHRRYSRMINFREGWRGHLWQGRFRSFPMDYRHLYHAVRYIELNPVRARLIQRSEEYPWSSAAAHLSGRDNQLVKVRPLLGLFGNWKRLLDRSVEEDVAEKIRLHERTGRPFGTDEFIEKLEKQLGRKLTFGKRGPKEKQKFANHDLSELSMVSPEYGGIAV